MATVDLRQLIDILPQKYPFLMIDSIVAYEEGVSLTAVKNITGSEWIYDGGRNSLDGKFPETLIMEAAAQTALAFCHAHEGLTIGGKFLLGKLDTEFFREVKVGERLTFRTDGFRKMGKSGFIAVKCFADTTEIGNVQVFYGLLE
jgi:3-hydroxyacyl-[acyl-carrier-protein] dehydratase